LARSLQTQPKAILPGTFKSFILDRNRAASIKLRLIPKSRQRIAADDGRRTARSLDVLAERCGEYDARIEYFREQRKRRATWTKFLELKIGQLLGIFEDTPGRRVVGGIEGEDEGEDEHGDEVWGAGRTWGLFLYAFYFLHTHPSTHASLCAELDTVLGPSATSPATLKASPHLINALPYTTAVFKETLRTFPPASTLRAVPANSPQLREIRLLTQRYQKNPQ
jgi:hypothetical protein